MPRNITPETKRGSVGTEPTDPRSSRPRQPSKTVEPHVIPTPAAYQLARAAAFDGAVAALAPLSAEDRARAAALAGVEVVLKRARRDLAPKEAAVRAGCSTATVLRWIARFGIGHRVGGRYVVDAASLDALLTGGVR